MVGIKDLMQGQPAIQAPLLLDEFKQRPEIAVLIRAGDVEYSPMPFRKEATKP